MKQSENIMGRKKILAAFAFALAVSLVANRPALAEAAYQKPPTNVLNVLHAPLPPIALFDPTHHNMLLVVPVRYPPIADLAEPMLRMAGSRLIPTTRRLQNQPYCDAYELVKLPDGSQRPIALPNNAKVGFPEWSADGQHFAFNNVASDCIELWVGDADRAEIRRIPGVKLNPMLGNELQWLPDQKTLLVKAIAPDQGPPPAEQASPPGPDIQEASGEKGPSSTYELRDVLKNQHDEDLFDYYGQSQLLLVDVVSGRTVVLGKPGRYASVTPAPDGEHLLVETIHHPYSYLTTHLRFPREVEIWNLAGAIVHKIASLPLADSVPIWGVPTGPRDFAWRATEPATLIWAEALDGGNWKTQAPARDRIMRLKAPFEAEPTEILRIEDRFDGFLWGEKDGLALFTEFNPIKHWQRTYVMNFDDLKAEPRLVWDMSTDERYNHPGSPGFRTLPNGYSVIHQEGGAIYLSGPGASTEGDRPFLDKLDLKTLKTERLFRSEKTAYESFAAWYDPSAGKLITRRESPKDPPNFFLRTLGKRVEAAPKGEPEWNSALSPITQMTDPTPQLRGITKRLVKYKRDDGVDLSFTLYLPAGYQEGTRLPAVFWAYPLDYSDAKMAGQVVGSTQRFTLLGWPLQLFFLLDGYAVIDNPLLPIVGDPEKMYDTYMEQLVAGAKAAVDKAVELGVVDRDRIGVTGHSHGALMTANLLAHSDLFRAGIARSGSYNKSLTAFGFQNERRTLWEAPEVYTKVSTLFHADKIKTPLLLIHGEADMNPGTVPLQSQKLFEAIRGNGGTARLVMLPYESHGYVAMESTEHVLYEMFSWFDKYVKNAPPRSAGQQP
ncbi:Peptidase S9, prolyl oligopeptidase [Verrucomicrobia bacterium]|nr:Peptidase S9, prolyl oligopeptidase [Verrucomicrobiota bacterium]